MLEEILMRRIQDSALLALIREVIKSHSPGLPLGNLTSQLLVNSYMNEFDHYVKHRFSAKHYIRYADDFVILSCDRTWLVSLIPSIRKFLAERLKLTLHPYKVSINTISSGVDFLGWVHFPDHRVVRTSTKRRAIRNSLGKGKDAPVTQAYCGIFSHGNAVKVQEHLFMNAK